MRIPRLIFVSAFVFAVGLARPEARSAVESAAKPRLVVLTDVSNEPDDEESLVRLLVYSNEFDLEGLIATTSTWLREKPRADLIRRDLAAYAEVRPNLLRHAPGFPAVDTLLSATCEGQPGFGLDDVGEGKSTAGSQHIADVVDRDDPRPVWIAIWGGANTLAQTLRDLRATRSPGELRRFIAKLRVYSISDQDDAGPWLRREFPDLFYIVTPSRPDSHDYYRATWTGISGGRGTQNVPGYHFAMVDNPWLEENVIRQHGPLGALYPHRLYLMEGDTPSFLGLIDRGLGWADNPAYGGWGGRYVLYQPLSESRPIWTDNDTTQDTVVVDRDHTDASNQATIWRWREAFQNDFAARMDWCVADRYDRANHNPRAVLAGDHSTRVLTFAAKGGADFPLSAEGTDDPDHNALQLSWWIYPEASTLPGATLSATEGISTIAHLPAANKAGTVHVILQVRDDGTPPLYAYRRAIIAVAP